MVGGVVKAGDTLHVYSQGTSLFVQETGQLACEMFCFDKNQFDFEQLEFEAKFSIFQEGKAQLLSFQRNGDSFLKAKRLE